MGKDVGINGHGLIKVISWYLTGGRETTKNLRVSGVLAKI
jgi:hypothetical protein